ncbi:SRPBCC family protein [Georgenia sp. 311]|uniref:SRPBCC family protein n=1 Tax=Georgenia sp. 311 TaxID=2585134 RepID=UPI001111E847|nr:SRPBCC family protein [Georgenia sp. 311]TNC18617.1 SRPBCC family protein [Georgenia sp. 311]
MSTTLTLNTRTRHRAEDLFDLSLSIDTHVASMAGSDEHAVAGTTSGQIGLGETVTWRARHLGVWFTMTAEVIELDRPRRFVDQQVRGPFRSFVHEHDFLQDGGSAVMTDTFTIAAPILGRLTEPLLLVPYLRRLITQRNNHMLAVLDGRDS